MGVSLGLWPGLAAAPAFEAPTIGAATLAFACIVGCLAGGGVGFFGGIAATFLGATCAFFAATTFLAGAGFFVAVFFAMGAFLAAGAFFAAGLAFGAGFFGLGFAILPSLSISISAINQTIYTRKTNATLYPSPPT
jgi:hypothetical protein